MPFSPAIISSPRRITVTPSSSAARIAASAAAFAGGDVVIDMLPGVYNWTSGLSLNGFSSVTISGAGAKIICGGTDINSYITPFAFANCGKVEIEGGVIDYLNLPFAQGVCTAVDTVAGTATLAIDVSLGVPTFGNIERMIINDPVTGFMTGVVFTFLEDRTGPPYAFTQIGNSSSFVISGLPGSATSIIQVGVSYLVDHQPFGRPAITATDVGELRMSGLTVHAACGQALFTKRVGRSRIEKCYVEPPMGSGRWQAANAAAWRFTLSSDYVEIIDTRVVQCGDDGANVSAYEFPVSGLSGRQFTLDLSRFQPTVTVGSYFWFCDPNGAVALDGQGNPYLGKVATVTGVNTATCVITFTGAIPSGFADGWFIFFTAYNPRILVQGNTFSYNRGRGVVATNSNVLIASNSFLYNFYAAISAGNPYSFVFAQFSPQADVMISGNLIVGSCFVDTNISPSAIEGLIDIPFTRNPAPAGTGRRLTVQGNVFANIQAGGLAAAGWDGLVIKGNHFHNVALGLYGGPFGDYAIAFENCRNVEIDGNSVIGSVNAYTGVGQTSADNVILGSNPGFVWAGDSSIASAIPSAMTIQSWLTPGTYTWSNIPQSAKFIRMILQSSAGGGGGGARQASGFSCSGGAGGGAGGILVADYPPAVLGASRVLTVPAGGAGGLAAAADNTAGGQGGDGANASIGGLAHSSAGSGGAGGQLAANSGGGGAGNSGVGSSSAGSGTTAGTGALNIGNGGSGATSANVTVTGSGSGGAGGLNGGAGPKSGNVTGGPSGGGAGGGLSAGGTTFAGGDSGTTTSGNSTNNATGGLVGSPGGAGGPPVTYSGMAFGGAGGGASLTAAGKGGDGAQGSGGAGGGSAQNGGVAGDGGKGGDGAISAIAFY